MIEARYILRAGQIDIWIADLDLLASMVGSTVLCAPLGLDVEEIVEPTPLHLVRDCFANEERSPLEARPQHEQALCFYANWMLKEAYFQATGTGLRVPLTEETRIPAETLRTVAACVAA